ncbi:MAG: Purine nucleoside phosphorylase [Candidatus Bathyarchaeota archaeon BA1]|nr:MAG: Purine nucleoside phosphorylase [Candidatus Bathyarchaeota archaeon BA1]
MRKRIQPHIMCGVGDVEKHVLLSGDPKRVERIASFFDESRKVAEYRGYVTYTGSVDGIGISACSTGIGCPSAAIVVEELARIGAETFIRVGTAGGLQPEIEIGDLVIATAAVRADGTTRNYISIEYPAVADFNVVSALIRAAEKLRRKVHLGLVWTSDAFYAEDVEVAKRWSEANVLSVEMECSTIFTLAGLKRLRAGAILAVDGNLIKGVRKGEFEPGEKTGELDERVQRAIEEEIRIAIEASKILERKSQTITSLSGPSLVFP